MKNLTTIAIIMLLSLTAMADQKVKTTIIERTFGTLVETNVQEGQTIYEITLPEGITPDLVNMNIVLLMMEEDYTAVQSWTRQNNAYDALYRKGSKMIAFIYYPVTRKLLYVVFD